MIPSCSHTGTPRHFHSSTTSGSASFTKVRSRLSISPRQSGSSLILASISWDGDSLFCDPLFVMPVSLLSSSGPASRRDLLQQRVDARKPCLRALLDAVLHCGVALLGRLEAHRLRQLRLLTEVLELQRLQVVLESLHEALGWLDLVKRPLDDTVGSSEPVGAAGADVHLLDDCAVAPPFGDQLRIRPDGIDVWTWCVEDPLDADLELVRGGHGGAHRAPFVRSTTCAKRSSRCNHVLMPSKA